jgi:hypothetical protein
MLVAMFVAFVIGGAILTLLIGQMQFTASQNRNIINQDDVRATLAFMADEIRTAGDGCAEPFVLQATPTSFSFQSDLDGNGVPDRVLYSEANGILVRTLSATADGGLTWSVVATDTLLSNISEFLFTYYGSNNTTLPAINDTTSVQMRMALDVTSTETALTQGKLYPQAMVMRATIRNRSL